MQPPHHPLSQVYSFVPIPGTQQHKRPRRRYEEIERMYKCGWNGCEKAYGTLNHLNAHVTMQSHGSKRTPEGMFTFSLCRVALRMICRVRMICGRAICSASAYPCSGLAVSLYFANVIWVSGTCRNSCAMRATKGNACTLFGVPLSLALVARILALASNYAMQVPVASVTHGLRANVGYPSLWATRHITLLSTSLLFYITTKHFEEITNMICNRVQGDSQGVEGSQEGGGRPAQG